MADHMSPAIRRTNMQAIRSIDTTPVMTVRRFIHSRSYRYRLHAKWLPGKPDFAFGPRRKVIFVHGCFWHQHAGCKDGHRPRTSIDYWKPKFSRNVLRDYMTRTELSAAGWEILTIWECETGDLAGLGASIGACLQIDAFCLDSRPHIKCAVTTTSRSATAPGGRSPPPHRERPTSAPPGLG